MFSVAERNSSPTLPKYCGVCNQITFLILYYIIFKQVTLLLDIDAPIQVPNIFYLTISFKTLNFSFQIIKLFFPEMSASIMSYMVQIIYIALASILYSLNFSLLPFFYKT